MHNVCTCGHHIAVPFLVVVFGATFLMGYAGMMTQEMINFVWPLWVILAGVWMLIDKMGLCKCNSGGKGLCC